MNVMILGASGFIGTNLAIRLGQVLSGDVKISLVGNTMGDICHLFENDKAYSLIDTNVDFNTDLDQLLDGQDMVFHLLSSSVPTTSNQAISTEIEQNVVLTSRILDACVKNKVKRVLFLSSGGTVYGLRNKCPLHEETPLNPITSYGLQKMSIEKLLYLYNYIFGLDYRIVRLSNPYGPYQKPNGVQGVVTTFIHKALHHEKLVVYGDGTVVRDFIYIDDAISGIINICFDSQRHFVYNLGSGKGTSVTQVIDCIKTVIDRNIEVEYIPGRKVDVPVNYLDISRYVGEFERQDFMSLEDGIRKTADFFRKQETLG